MTTVVYESPAVTLHLGKAEDVLPTFAPESVDLIATDPPYGVKFLSNWGRNFTSIVGDDGTLDTAGIIHLAVLACLRRRRHVYVFGPADLSALPLRTAELVWDKTHTGLGDLTLPWGPSHERITFGVHVPTRQEMTDGRGGLAARLRAASVLRVARPNGSAVNRHPNEKPVALMRDLVESSTVRGEVVLDPFAGSGSTLVAALLAGRRAVGIEVDPRYADVAARRLEATERITKAAARL